MQRLSTQTRADAVSQMGNSGDIGFELALLRNVTDIILENYPIDSDDLEMAELSQKLEEIKPLLNKVIID